VSSTTLDILHVERRAAPITQLTSGLIERHSLIARFIKFPPPRLSKEKENANFYNKDESKMESAYIVTSLSHSRLEGSCEEIALEVRVIPI
jgi:hypothetical protein